MPNILPFGKTKLLINDIDEFFDRVTEAALVLERAMQTYFDVHDPDDLFAKIKQIRSIEERADELRRNIANVMYAEMLMPDTRGDVMSLLSLVDTTLDACVHLLAGLAIERPPIGEEYVDSYKAMALEVSKTVGAMLRGARIYFRQPDAVREYTHRISFHEREVTSMLMEVGKSIFDSDLPLERKRQLGAWLGNVRRLASQASDVGDQLAIFAMKRSV